VCHEDGDKSALSAAAGIEKMRFAAQ